jgi:sarcosine oxidase gamma subunit
VLELQRLDVAVVASLARADVLDRLRLSGAVALRVASDELLFVTALGNVDMLMSAVSAEIGDGGLVVDQSDGFTGWTLRGDDAPEAFSRLSAIPLARTQPAFQQGLVAGAPAKILVADGEIHLLVPSPLGHHIRERVLCGCADLAPQEADAPLAVPAVIEAFS